MADKGRVLITGVSGFIGKHLAREFLEHGYRVRGTVRAPEKARAVCQALASHVDIGAFETAEADLVADGGWDAALEGVDHVVHAASPFPLAQPRNPAVLVRPAVDGTMRVLLAAERAGAATFVQTSSSAAIYPGHGGRMTPYTPEDWANLGSPAATPYVLSKTLAERTARDHVDASGGKLRFMTVNPSFVLGPLLDRTRGSSADVVAMLMKGKYPATPRFQLSIVDVRDVAAAHRLAVERGAHAGRYIAAAGSLWMREMGKVLKAALGKKARRAPTRQLPDAVVRLVGLFDPSVRAVVAGLGQPVVMDASATEHALGLRFRPAEEALVETAHSLVALGLV